MAGLACLADGQVRRAGPPDQGEPTAVTLLFHGDLLK